MRKPVFPLIILGAILVIIFNCSNHSNIKTPEKDNIQSKNDTIITKKKHTDINQFWTELKKAYLKSDLTALNELIKQPVRENLFPDIPMHTLKSFLVETSNMKLYNLESFYPVKNQKLKEYGRFEKYIFQPEDIIYEVDMTRWEGEQLYQMALYIIENNGLFYLFAFDSEVTPSVSGD